MDFAREPSRGKYLRHGESPNVKQPVFSYAPASLFIHGEAANEQFHFARRYPFPLCLL